MVLPCIGQIPHLFLRHSSTALRIRPIRSFSIKMAAEDYTFGPYKIHNSEVFYSTNLSYAMVNLRPLLPDVLICPKREVKRFADLTADETSDLWLTAQEVGRQLESYHKASSLTFAIQDGPQAGQTVPHVHIHVVPRIGGDFEKNDEIYDAMDEKERELKEKLDLDKERKDRSIEEMSQEMAVEYYDFGPYKIHHTSVFHTTDLSFAFVNLRPAVTVICPKREVKRVADLTTDENIDLWNIAQKFGRQLETYHKASSLTFCIQDGPQAGQSVPHVHIHILPRKIGDYENNDDIYEDINEKEKELKRKLEVDIERKDRSLEVMAQEADEYRKFVF